VPAAVPASNRPALAESAARLGPALLIRLLALALEGKDLVAVSDTPAVAVAVAVGRLALWPRLQRVEALLAGEGAPTSAPARPVASGSVATGDAHAIAGPAARLVAALERMGAHLVAGRVGSVREVLVVGDTLVLRCGSLPAATQKSLRDASEQLAAAAREAGLATRVELDGNGSPKESHDSDLRARVESDEGVKRALEVFGGRLESVEEKP
jgi:hypothetical protein